ncbi:unnamed protein product [Polarella glacialis]|uniref:Uncharacterized protein n=1 Tax=Polarella glacialis TaxID=89957 RepID=A0A813M0Z0_POLGL|nr:unnamed protein product [Polarella glacialis]
MDADLISYCMQGGPSAGVPLPADGAAFFALVREEPSPIELSADGFGQDDLASGVGSSPENLECPASVLGATGGSLFSGTVPTEFGGTTLPPLPEGGSGLSAESAFSAAAAPLEAPPLPRSPRGQPLPPPLGLEAELPSPLPRSSPPNEAEDEAALEPEAEQDPVVITFDGI